jgi:hypothetical protein
VDRDVRGDRRAALAERVEDQRRVEPREPRAAVLLADVDAAQSELGGLAQDVDREVLRAIPLDRVRGQALGRERARQLADLALILGELERAGARRRSSSDGRRSPQLIVGITKLAPSRGPEGQREVTVFVFV